MCSIRCHGLARKFHWIFESMADPEPAEAKTSLTPRNVGTAMKKLCVVRQSILAVRSLWSAVSQESNQPTARHCPSVAANLIGNPVIQLRSNMKAG